MTRMQQHEFRRPNPEMLTLAREARGLTQSGLSRQVDISQGHISKMEAGLWEVTPDSLSKIARELRFPESFFFSKEPVFGPGVSEFYHRKKQSTGALLLRKTYALINIFLIHLSRLLRGVDIGECKIPRFDESDPRPIPDLAKSLRAFWGLPSGPIANLVGAVEMAGGIVVRWDFGTSTIDGISRWAPGLPPVFFINRQVPMDRFRLTLAHELGHMVLHESPIPMMETEANEFAREFLMPGSEVKRHLQGCNLHKLSTLKPYWKVSMAALLYAAQDLGAIDEERGRSLWIQMQPYRRREPPELDLPDEKPRLLDEIFRVYRQSLGYSLADLSVLLTALPEELEEPYGLTPGPQDRPRIRLVK